MKMRAAVLHETGRPRPYARSRPLTVEEVELDPPGPGELLVEVTGAGLCHSDLSVISRARPRPLPLVIGHEGAGIVREVGPEVHDLKPGDHVVFVFAGSCGHCRYCDRGRPNICTTQVPSRLAGALPSGQRRLRWRGAPLNHFLGVSLFAEYAVAHRRSMVKIDPDVPLDDAAVLGCAVLTGAGAVLNTARLEPGGEIAVVGLGGVGMNALLGAVVSGAERIVAVDTNPDKLRLAREWGATDTVLAGRPETVAEVRDLTDGGLDVVIETAGSVPAMETAIAITARGGRTISAGLPEVGSPVSYLHAALVTDERSIQGSYMGSCVPERDIPRFVALYRRGKLPIERLRSGFITLDEINEGFDRLAEGGVLRQILKPGGIPAA